MKISVRGIPSEYIEMVRAGKPDANGQPAVVQTAEGVGNPCRHCLQRISTGDEMLVLAYRPFNKLQPYAEVGPIFLHKQACTRYDNESLPAWLSSLPTAIIRGYDKNDCIRYETGQVVAGNELEAVCRQILSNPATDYIHIRSKYNCFQCQVERA